MLERSKLKMPDEKNSTGLDAKTLELAGKASETLKHIGDSFKPEDIVKTKEPEKDSDDESGNQDNLDPDKTNKDDEAKSDTTDGNTDDILDFGNRKVKKDYVSKVLDMIGERDPDTLKTFIADYDNDVKWEQKNHKRGEELNTREKAIQEREAKDKQEREEWLSNREQTKPIQDEYSDKINAKEAELNKILEDTDFEDRAEIRDYEKAKRRIDKEIQSLEKSRDDAIANKKNEAESNKKAKAQEIIEQDRQNLSRLVDRYPKDFPAEDIKSEVAKLTSLQKSGIDVDPNNYPAVMRYNALNKFCDEVGIQDLSTGYELIQARQSLKTLKEDLVNADKRAEEKVRQEFSKKGVSVIDTEEKTKTVPDKPSDKKRDDIPPFFKGAGKRLLKSQGVNIE